MNGAKYGTFNLSTSVEEQMCLCCLCKSRCGFKFKEKQSTTTLSPHLHGKTKMAIFKVKLNTLN